MTELTMDQSGLRAYMQKVYGYMTGGLLLSALTAWIGTKPFFMKLFYNVSAGSMSLSFLGWVMLFAPLLMIFPLNAAVMKQDESKAQGWFWAFSAVMGFSFSSIFFIFSLTGIVQALVIAGGMFAVTALYGYTTGRDLTNVGSFMFMGLVGIIIASIVNIFVASRAFDYVLSYLIVFVFLGLTAYDTQKIKETYAFNNNALAIYGAVSLYLDFINLFRAILTITNRDE